ncbi:MAG: hypothetical protein V4438_04465 [Patescibacteria group bacterium]
MKTQKIKKIFFGMLTMVIVCGAALPALAADPITDSPANNAGFHIVSCGGKDQPECDWAQLIKLANTIVIFLVWLSASLAVIAFCYAGFLYMTAFGESGKIEQAHSIFKSSITGIFFVLCGWLIIATILSVLKADPDIVNSVDFKNVKTIQGQAN